MDAKPPPHMNVHSLQTYDHFGYALVALVGTFCAVVVILWVLQRPASRARVFSLRGVAPPFINIVGVLFGLTLAFIANDTWNAHDRATNAVYREADALQSLVVLTGRLADPLAGELRAELHALAQASTAEWPLLASRRASPETEARADALLLRLASADVATQAGPAVQSLMLKRASDLRDDRKLRIGLSQMHVNPLKWLGMAFLGLLTLLSIAVVHVENPRAAAVSCVLFALSAAPMAAIVLIQSNPFQPPSFVSPAPLLAAVAR